MGHGDHPGHTMNGRHLAIGAAAIGSGLLGGVLFAFSSFVMPALRRIPASEGISAMQSINRRATTFAFGALIVVTVALAAGLGLHALVRRGQPGAGWVGAGSISMIIALAITGGFNIPRNDRLASFDASTPEAAVYWPTFLTEWVLANHLRTAFCIIAAATYTVALRPQ
jgi:uncharacterized membrane protein